MTLGIIALDNDYSFSSYLKILLLHKTLFHPRLCKDRRR